MRSTLSSTPLVQDAGGSREQDRRREIVVGLVSEIVLCVKEANTKTRGTAYALLVQVWGRVWKCRVACR